MKIIVKKPNDFLTIKKKKGWPIYKTKKAAIKKIQASSFKEDDSNTGKFHKRIYEELQGNLFRPNLQPTFLNTAGRDLESKKPYNAENYGWLMVLGKTHPCFDYHKFFKTYPEAFKQIYRLRDFMKYRIVEWDNKDQSDPIKRMELDLNPISTGLFCLVVALGGGGVFSTPLP